jgi:hypothetical protein
MSNILQNERDKEIKNAYTLMKNAKPDAYEQARIHYYTLKEGQGWLRTEKERLITTEIDPFLNQLNDEFKDLMNSSSSSQNSNNTNEIGDEAETRYLKKKLMQEKDKVSIHNRLLVLGSNNNTIVNTSWLPFILDILIAILGISIVYLLASGKYSKILNIFKPTQIQSNI